MSDKAVQCPNCGVPIKIVFELLREQEQELKQEIDKEETVRAEIKDNRIFLCDGIKYDLSEIYQRHHDYCYDEHEQLKPYDAQDLKKFIQTLYDDILSMIPSLTYDEVAEMRNYFLWEKTVPISLEDLHDWIDEHKAATNKLVKDRLAEEVEQSSKSETLCCPRCGSTAVSIGQRGFSILYGFWGSNKTVNRCGRCVTHGNQNGNLQLVKIARLPKGGLNFYSRKTYINAYFRPKYNSIIKYKPAIRYQNCRSAFAKAYLLTK